MDVTSNTVTSEVLKTGYTAIGSDGETVEGAYAAKLQSKEVTNSGVSDIIGSGEDTFVFFSTTNEVAAHDNITTYTNHTLKLKEFDSTKKYNIVGVIKVIDVNNNILDVININNKLNNANNDTQYLDIKANDYLNEVDFKWSAANTNYSYLAWRYKTGTCGLIIRIGVFENSEEYDGLSTIVINPPDNYSVYKHLTYKSSISSSSSHNTIFQSFFNSLSIVNSYMFQNIEMRSNFTFPNCTKIETYGFGHNGYNTCGSCTFSFPELITIGTYAFNYQSKMSLISCPKVETISGSAFYNCTSLTAINCPSCVSIGVDAFYGCSNLSIANFSSCTSIRASTFCKCSNLSIASFPMCTIVSSYAFAYCSALTSVSFPACITIEGNAFAYCSALTIASFPSCTSIGTGAFSDCTSLTTISFPACTYIGNSAFRYCFNLVSLYLTSVSSVPQLGVHAFVSTPIDGYSAVAGRYGSVYVPASLYASFLTATRWSAISARIVSV